MDNESNEEELQNEFDQDTPELRDPRPHAKPWRWLRRVSIGCTAKCSKYNWCRVKSLSFGRCRRPYGCNCSKFAWEGK